VDEDSAKFCWFGLTVGGRLALSLLSSNELTVMAVIDKTPQTLTLVLLLLQAIIVAWVARSTAGPPACTDAT